MSAHSDASGTRDREEGDSLDELLSVEAVARAWGTGLNVVIDLVRAGQLPSLDRGLLLSEGRFDVPVIRRSWLDGVPGISWEHRIVAPPEGEMVHPAVEPAYEFHSALDEGDAERVWRYSTAASRAGRTPDELMTAWKDVGGHLHDMNAGIGTTVYTLRPVNAVAVRVVGDAPALPRMITGPAPVTLLDVLPLVEEAGGWRVDLPLFESRSGWIQSLASPPSESDSRS